MAESGKRNQQKPAETMTNEQLISFAGQLTDELQRRVRNNVASGDPAVCAAIFDVIAAAQQALIANNCPGV